jgi:hypothetical protein
LAQILRQSDRLGITIISTVTMDHYFVHVKYGPDKIGPRQVLSPLHRRSQQYFRRRRRTDTARIPRRETKLPRNHVRRQLDYRQGWINQMHTDIVVVAVTFRDALDCLTERLHGEFQTVVQRTVLFERSVREFVEFQGQSVRDDGFARKLSHETRGESSGGFWCEILR